MKAILSHIINKYKSSSNLQTVKALLDELEEYSNSIRPLTQEEIYERLTIQELIKEDAENRYNEISIKADDALGNLYEHCFVVKEEMISTFKRILPILESSPKPKSFNTNDTKLMKYYKEKLTEDDINLLNRHIKKGSRIIHSIYLTRVYKKEKLI